MNMIRLCMASLKFRALGNIFNVIVLALGVALVVMLLQVSSQLERRFDNDLEGIDLVVGAKGSPLQLILASVFHLDAPTGNIPLAEADKLKKNGLIKSTIPLALGDSYHGFRIVGTTPDYAKHYNAELAEGEWWTDSMQAVLGSEVARSSGLKIGDKFAGSHGLTEGGEEHSATPYTVKAILKPTGSVIDRLLLCNVESVWNVHNKDPDEHVVKGREPPQEITSLLVTYKTPLAAATLPRMINTTTSLQAASPAIEMARMVTLLGTGSEVARIFAYSLMTISAIGAFISLLAAVNERRYDMALLRTLGMTRGRLSGFVIMQGVILGVAGALLGLVLGHSFSGFATEWIESTRHISLPPAGFYAYELWIGLAAVVLSAFAALIPAILAYRMNVTSVLSRRS